MRRMALNQVHSGWLTKSPPEKNQGRLKLFKAQWRRRYFVLSSSCQSKSPGGAGGGEVAPPVFYLHYYDNDKNPKKSRKKGCIDLTSCEEILAELESDCYGNVFSLRTQHKGRSRTYCLAADSVEEMNHWVNCLIRVLQMDDSDSPMTSPGGPPFQTSPGGKSVSSPTRNKSLPHKTKASQDQPSRSSALGHLSIQVDTPSSFSAELAETRLGTRGSQSYCSPLVPGPCFQFFPVDSNVDSPPPSLPAKGRRCRDPCSAIDGESRISCRRGGSDSERDNNYDVLPIRRPSIESSNDADYDFPPLGLLSGTGNKTPDETTSARRESTSSHSDVFESMEDLSSPFSTSLHMTSRTKSFRRSTSRSDPPTPLAMGQEKEVSHSSSDEAEPYEHLQKEDDNEYTDLY